MSAPPGLPFPSWSPSHSAPAPTIPADTAAAVAAVKFAPGWPTSPARPSISAPTGHVTPDGAAYRFELPLAGPVGSTGWLIAADPVPRGPAAGRRPLVDRFAALPAR